jgi:hypothetical protein
MIGIATTVNIKVTNAYILVVSIQSLFSEQCRGTKYVSRSLMLKIFPIWPINPFSIDLCLSYLERTYLVWSFSRWLKFSSAKVKIKVNDAKYRSSYIDSFIFHFKTNVQLR